MTAKINMSGIIKHPERYEVRQLYRKTIDLAQHKFINGNGRTFKYNESSDNFDPFFSIVEKIGFNIITHSNYNWLNKDLQTILEQTKLAFEGSSDNINYNKI